ncbi:aminotransferase class III-fold pyridoxal phosphate-dependent enzyme [Saccharothrix australiensis]|uniref:Acetylornithine/succinyldiaminopimelate/putresci ne aminotransferase n=1 Tax=Saccharothrix australiensis TaxID=2072 RepID=A0A495VYM7_9PSEU|nr:aminotransferase class III-fold pyridoxal phosphate-dependent enzyme [Saccharothrix australiensis]RKT53857.1 acetylornithine/succinyldiaminopimelate/putrescine aminotransferase [Saccharothrix australiensis]
MTAPISYAEAFLTGVLSGFGMDVDYVRAEKDTLYHLDDSGAEAPVLDLVGGWGSTLLGHNNREIVAHAKALLDADAPIHAQFSLHPVADRVGARLNEILRREFPGAEPYSIIFANSGAEAVEAAAKHGEMARALRARELLDRIAWHADVAARAVRAGTATPGPLPGGGTPASIEELLGAVAEHNAERAARRPVFFALERAFHGKLIGSTQFTYNPAFRDPFAVLGLPARFVPPNDTAALEKAFDEERTAVLDVEVVDGVVTLVERDFPVFAGFLVEPIQGEGGIHELTAEFAARLRQVCDEAACPVVVDEIQTGMGRTGAFFASKHIGLLGDYYLLGKSLGGGVGKASALLVRQSLYRAEFELVHSSTFAKDGFSTAITLKALELLEADGGAVYARAAERGAAITGALRELAAEYPDVIVDIRGRGLMIGVEFADQSRSASAIIREKNASGLLSFVLGGYLQLAHAIRTGPTASAPNMLRIEPSVYLDDAEIDQLRTGFRALCEILRNQDGGALVHPLTWPGTAKAPAITDHRGDAPAPTAPAGRAQRKVGYVSYLPTVEALRELDPTLAKLDDDRLRGYVKRVELLKDLLPLEPVRVESPGGESVDLVAYPLMLTGEQLAGYRRAGLDAVVVGDVERRVRAAKADGCEFVGLARGLGAATAHGGALRVPGVTVSTGHALAAYSALVALESAAVQQFGGTEELAMAIVGGGGRVGAAAAELAAPHVRKITLVGSGGPGADARLREAARRVYQIAWEIIAGGGERAGIVAALAAEPLIVRWLDEGRAAHAPSGEAIAEWLTRTYDVNPFVDTTIDLSAVQDAQLVLSVTPTGSQVLSGQSIRGNAIVCDLANPYTGDGSARYVRGGALRAPGAASLPPGARSTSGDGEMSACAAEVVVRGFAGPGADLAAGRLTGSQDRAIAELAKEHGFRPITT